MQVEIWKFLAGLGFFLFGMNQLENVLKNISGRSLKLFLRRNTQNLFKAIFGGAIVTGIVQSSSVVSLIVLAFVEAGIITFRNALGVILGTNLGTTLDSWIVATVGFKLNILGYSLPIIAISSIALFFFEKRKNIYNLFSVLFALGILFLGLGFMKESALILVEGFDLSAIKIQNTFVFVVVGFILTTIIQSSSATVAITLTGIYAGILDFPSAASMVIGSEVGTTIKILIWGMKGSADKKRVAIGNFIYNIITSIIAYLALYLLIYLIQEVVKIKDPLIGLVFFQTTINFISIIIFIPFLNLFASWLEKRFTSDSNNIDSYISSNLPEETLLAIETFRTDTKHLLTKTRLFINTVLITNHKKNGILDSIKSFATTSFDFEKEYLRLKKTEGDLLEYYSKIQEQQLGKEDSNSLLQYIQAIRQLIYSAKAIKDIKHNLKEFESSANDLLHEQGIAIWDDWKHFDAELNQIAETTDNAEAIDIIKQSLTQIKTAEAQKKLEVIKHLKQNLLSEVEASTLMNVNREIYSSKKQLLKVMASLEANHIID
jgi:phosphate:Na+ symporter